MAALGGGRRPLYLRLAVPALAARGGVAGGVGGGAGARTACPRRRSWAGATLAAGLAYVAALAFLSRRSGVPVFGPMLEVLPDRLAPPPPGRAGGRPGAAARAVACRATD